MKLDSERRYAMIEEPFLCLVSCNPHGLVSFSWRLVENEDRLQIPSCRDGGESSSRIHCRQGKKEFVLVSSIQSVSNLYVGPQAFGPVFAKIYHERVAWSFQRLD